MESDADVVDDADVVVISSSIDDDVAVAYKILRWCIVGEKEVFDDPTCGNVYDKFLDVEDEDEVDDGSMKPLAW